MKRIIYASGVMLVVFVAVFSMFVLRPVPKVKAHRGCSKETLKGTYAITGSGSQGISAPFTPFSIFGTMEFDGKGDFSWSFFTTVAGAEDNPSSTGGSYVITSDCLVSLDTVASVDPFSEDLLFEGAVVSSSANKVTANILGAVYHDLTGTAVLEMVADGE